MHHSPCRPPISQSNLILNELFLTSLKAADLVACWFPCWERQVLLRLLSQPWGSHPPSRTSLSSHCFRGTHRADRHHGSRTQRCVWSPSGQQGPDLGLLGFKAASSYQADGDLFEAYFKDRASFLTFVENQVLHDLIAVWRRCGRVTRGLWMPPSR